jgi:hypothetical protein
MGEASQGDTLSQRCIINYSSQTDMEHVLVCYRFKPWHFDPGSNDILLTENVMRPQLGEGAVCAWQVTKADDEYTRDTSVLHRELRSCGIMLTESECTVDQ